MIINSVLQNLQCNNTFITYTFYTYTSRFLLTGYVYLVKRSTDEATASQGTIVGTMRVLCAVTGWIVASVTVASEDPHSTLKGTLTCSSHTYSGAAQQETYIASRRNLDVHNTVDYDETLCSQIRYG